MNKSWEKMRYSDKALPSVGFYKVLFSYRRTDSFSGKTLPLLVLLDFFLFYFVKSPYLTLTRSLTSSTHKLLCTLDLVPRDWPPPGATALPPYPSLRRLLTDSLPGPVHTCHARWEPLPSAGEEAGPAHTQPLESRRPRPFHSLPWPPGALQGLLDGVSCRNPHSGPLLKSRGSP